MVHTNKILIKRQLFGSDVEFKTQINKTIENLMGLDYALVVYSLGDETGDVCIEFGELHPSSPNSLIPFWITMDELTAINNIRLSSIEKFITSFPSNDEKDDIEESLEEITNKEFDA